MSAKHTMWGFIQTRDEQTMRMKTCSILILTEMEAESEEDDDDEDDDGKKVSGDVTQSWGHSSPQCCRHLSLFTSVVYCHCFLSLPHCHCLGVHCSCYFVSWVIMTHRLPVRLFKTMHHWFGIVFREWHQTHCGLLKKRISPCIFSSWSLH